uniref:Uncharacterized protein n=1 Tax=Anopheles atroparvus TaxID=41427 RepID=A0A182ILG2_ANOAO
METHAVRDADAGCISTTTSQFSGAPPSEKTIKPQHPHGYRCSSSRPLEESHADKLRSGAQRVDVGGVLLPAVTGQHAGTTPTTASTLGKVTVVDVVGVASRDLSKRVTVAAVATAQATVVFAVVRSHQLVVLREMLLRDVRMMRMVPARSSGWQCNTPFWAAGLALPLLLLLLRFTSGWPAYSNATEPPFDGTSFCGEWSSCSEPDSELGRYATTLDVSLELECCPIDAPCVEFECILLADSAAATFDAIADAPGDDAAAIEVVMTVVAIGIFCAFCGASGMCVWGPVGSCAPGSLLLRCSFSAFAAALAASFELDLDEISLEEDFAADDTATDEDDDFVAELRLESLRSLRADEKPLLELVRLEICDFWAARSCFSLLLNSLNLSNIECFWCWAGLVGMFVTLPFGISVMLLPSDGVLFETPPPTLPRRPVGPVPDAPPGPGAGVRCTPTQPCACDGRISNEYNTLQHAGVFSVVGNGFSVGGRFGHTKPS